MNRFGRSSDQRWRDRWGGGFVIVTVLALAGAWYLGNYLSDKWAAGEPESVDAVGVNPNLTAPGSGATNNLPAGQADLAAYPKPLTVYFLQSDAFKTQEQADKAAQARTASGVPAAVVQSDGWYKVIIGAYGSKEAANQAKESATANYKGKGKLTVFARSLNIAAQPAIQPADQKAAAAFRQGVAALNGYLHAASTWWDMHATGQTPPADSLAVYTSQLQSAMNQLKAYESDPAVNQLISLANQAMANGTQMTALATGTASTPAAAQGGAPTPGRAGSSEMQAAMQGYVTLLDQYRNWTAVNRQ